MFDPFASPQVPLQKDSRLQDSRFSLFAFLVTRLIITSVSMYGEVTSRNHQAPVVQRLDNSIHRINHYLADSVVCFVSPYPLDSDLSGG